MASLLKDLRRRCQLSLPFVGCWAKHLAYAASPHRHPPPPPEPHSPLFHPTCLNLSIFFFDFVYQDLLRGKLLANPGRALVALEPSTGAEEAARAAEAARLAAVRATHTPAELTALVDETAALKAAQVTDYQPTYRHPPLCCAQGRLFWRDIARVGE